MALHFIGDRRPCIHCGSGGGIKPSQYRCSICGHAVHKKCAKGFPAQGIPSHDEQFKHPKEDNE